MSLIILYNWISFLKILINFLVVSVLYLNPMNTIENNFYNIKLLQMSIHNKYLSLA